MKMYILRAGARDIVFMLKKLLAQVDDRQGELSVRAVVYEVSSDESTGSAFGLALNVLGGKLGASVGAVNAVDTFFRLRTAGIDAVVSALLAAGLVTEVVNDRIALT